MVRDDSHIQQMLMQAASLESEAAGVRLDTALELKRPFMLLRPRLYQDGNRWCALLGENIQEGISGFGSTPDEASHSFDRAWISYTGHSAVA